MSKLLRYVTLVSILGCAAERQPNTPENRPDFSTSTADMSTSDVDVGLDRDTETSPPPGEQIRFTFRPDRPVYQVGDTIRVTAFKVEDADTDIPERDVSYSLQPSSIGQFDDSQRITVINEGTGRVIGCTADNRCGSRPFRVQSERRFCSSLASTPLSKVVKNEIHSR